MNRGPNRRPRVAVTGASGFIGRRLLARMVGDGGEVVALSRSAVDVAGVRRVPLCDYTDEAASTRALQGVDVLVHLAGRAHVTADGGDAVGLFQRGNVDATLAMARACVAARVRRFVFISSIGVHGPPVAGRPFGAADAPNPVEPYALSKWQAEQGLAAIGVSSGLEIVVLRPPLVYGPGAPGNYHRLLKLVARAPLLPLGGLRAPRSFIHLDNLVDAITLAVRHPAVAGRTFTVCDGRDLSVAEVVRELAGVLRPRRSPVIDVAPWLLAAAASLLGRRAAIDKLAAALQVDASEFVLATGWRPPVDPVSGLRESARQFRASGGGRGACP